MANSDPINLFLDFLDEKADKCGASILTAIPCTNTIIATGDVYSGLAIYSTSRKSFKFYYISSTDLLLRNEEALYEETNIKQFCEFLCRKSK